MKYIHDIKEGEHIVEHYLCKQKQSLKTRAGKTYYSLKLQDKTGIIDAKVWALSGDIQAFEEHDYIKIESEAITYQNTYQLNIKKIRRSMEGEYDPIDYIPCTTKSIEEMYQGILEYIKKVQNKYIKQLMEAFFVEDKEFIDLFRAHTAAKSIHHSYMGGLLEHTLSVVEISEFLAPRYDNVNNDLLIVGAIFHDIGKVKELSGLPINEYTEEGQLLGHIIIGLEMVSEKINKIPNFPPLIANFIKHCILSHHGELEYGSPKLPQTIEAMIIHCADNTDAKIKCFDEVINNDQSEGNWTEYHRMLQRSIRRSNTIL